MLRCLVINFQGTHFGHLQWGLHAGENICANARRQSNLVMFEIPSRRHGHRARAGLVLYRQGFLPPQFFKNEVFYRLRSCVVTRFSAKFGIGFLHHPQVISEPVFAVRRLLYGSHCPVAYSDPLDNRNEYCGLFEHKRYKFICSAATRRSAWSGYIVGLA